MDYFFVKQLALKYLLTKFLRWNSREFCLSLKPRSIKKILEAELMGKKFESRTAQRRERAPTQKCVKRRLRNGIACTLLRFSIQNLSLGMCSSTSIHYEANILFHKCTRTRANSRKEWYSTLRLRSLAVLDGQIYWFCNQTRCGGLFFCAARPLSFSVTAIQIQCVSYAILRRPLRHLDAFFFTVPAGRSFILLKGFFRRQTNAHGKMVAGRSSRRLDRRPDHIPQRETKSALRAEAGKSGSACNVHLPGLK